MNTHIREKRHRLPGEYYQGDAVCLRGRHDETQAEACGYGDMREKYIQAQDKTCGYGDYDSGIGGVDPDLIETFTTILLAAVEEANCIVPVYCFMPDHQHLIMAGKDRHADILRAIKAYKQKSGYWMAKNRRGICWQKDFYDHVIRNREEIPVQVRYILDNPVRRGMVSSWREYPYKGAIGCTLEDVLHGLM